MFGGLDYKEEKMPRKKGEAGDPGLVRVQENNPCVGRGAQQINQSSKNVSRQQLHTCTLANLAASPLSTIHAIPICIPHPTFPIDRQKPLRPTDLL